MARPKQTNKTLKYIFSIDDIKIEIETLQRRTDTFFITVSAKWIDPRQRHIRVDEQGDFANNIEENVKRSTKALFKKNMQFIRDEYICVCDISSIGNRAVGSFCGFELTVYLKDTIYFSYVNRNEMPEVCEVEDLAVDFVIIIDNAMKKAKEFIIQKMDLPRQNRKQKDEGEIDSYLI